MDSRPWTLWSVTTHTARPGASCLPCPHTDMGWVSRTSYTQQSLSINIELPRLNWIFVFWHSEIKGHFSPTKWHLGRKSFSFLLKHTSACWTDPNLRLRNSLSTHCVLCDDNGQVCQDRICCCLIVFPSVPWAYWGERLRIGTHLAPQMFAQINPSRMVVSTCR